MFERLQRLAEAPFGPHINCYLHVQELAWLHVVSDLLIGLSYVAISLALAYLVYRIRNLPFAWMYLAFGVFIIWCGITHFLAIVVVWDARYWLQGFIKAGTALASVGTAVLLPPLIPRAITLVRAAEVSEERKRRLEVSNAELEGLYQQVRQLDRLKTEFFTNVSHELRTPLRPRSGRPPSAPAAKNRRGRNWRRWLSAPQPMRRFAAGATPWCWWSRTTPTCAASWSRAPATTFARRRPATAARDSRGRWSCGPTWC
jgi:signal transduction histidine kinase